MRRLGIEAIEPGQKLARAVFNVDGKDLFRVGEELTPEHIQTLLQKGYTSVAIDDPQTRGIEVPPTVSDAVRRQAVAKVQETFDSLGEIAKELAGGPPDTVWKQMQQRSVVAGLRKPGAEPNVLPIVASLIENSLSAPTLDSLHSVLLHDDLSFNHSINVCVVAIKIGQAVELPLDRMRQLTLGCLQHDIGKIFVPREILNKRGKLSLAERQQVAGHAALGYHFLRSTTGAEVLAHHIAWQHHERQDGQGYPRGLTGANRVARTDEERFRPDRMFLLAEIAAVADFYDAISSDRPQRPGLASERIPAALTEVAGTLLNQEIVSKFVAVLPSFPTGTEVLVVRGPHAGCRGVVTLADRAHLRRPKIRISTDAKGAPMEPVDVDLALDEPTLIVSARQAMAGAGADQSQPAPQGAVV